MANEKAVVVGAGGVSGAWFGPLKAEGVEVAAVVDLDRQRAEERIREFDLRAEASDDLAGTLRRAKPDFVVDLTVTEAHCQVTCASLRAGCHVIGEKPMAASMIEARRMVRTAEKTGRTYMVSQSRRWETKGDTIRRTLASGAIGRVTTVNCDFFIGAHFGGFRDEMDSPLILDMAIHQFDLARFFTGLDPLAVYAKEFNPSGSWYAGDASAACIFEMTDGAIFAYRGSWCSEGRHTSWHGDWRIVGEKGTLTYAADQDPSGQVVAGSEGFFRPLKDLVVQPSPLEHTSIHGALREMLAFLREGRPPQTECHDNIKSLAMVFAVMQSSRGSRRVKIEA